MIIHAENTATNERVELEGVEPPGGLDVKVGDIFTVGGVHTAVPNTERRWWQFWKPRWVIGPLQRYRVTDIA